MLCSGSSQGVFTIYLPSMYLERFPNRVERCQLAKSTIGYSIYKLILIPYMGHLSVPYSFTHQHTAEFPTGAIEGTLDLCLSRST